MVLNTTKEICLEAVDKFNGLTKKTKEIICIGMTVMMLCSFVAVDFTSGAAAAGSNLGTPHAIMAGDEEIAVLQSKGDAEIVLENIKQAYGKDANTVAIITPAVTIVEKEFAPAEDRSVQTSQEATASILEINRSEDPAFQVVIEKSGVITETIQNETKYIETNSLAEGEEKVAQEGRVGKKVILANQTVVNGVAVKSEVYSEKVTVEAEDRIIYRGASYTWPVPSNHSVASPYGYRIHPVYKISKMHTGIDVLGGTGTTIVAASNGRVIEAGYHGSYGKCIKVRHSDGIVTLYAHLSSIEVSVGQTVEKGQRIAGMGSTGLSTGTHLHFEVQVNGSHTNPLNYV